MQKQKIAQPKTDGTDWAATIGRLRSDVTVVRVIGHVVIWAITSIVTLGLGCYSSLMHLPNSSLVRYS